MKLASIIEALLIASEEPLSGSELARLIRARVAEAEDHLSTQIEDGERNEDAQIPDDLKALAKTDENAVTAAIAELNHCYETTSRAFLCVERAKGWKIFTHPQYADFIRHLFPGHKPSRLSGPAMETLAIIAYRQPVTKASLEAVRGVSCDGMLQKLLDRELIKVGGRAQLPGRPLLYETTDLFFEHFGIKSVDDLPNSSELRTVKLPEPEEEASATSQVPPQKTSEVEEQLALSAIHHQIKK
jgi:segregation and condensation protein B